MDDDLHRVLVVSTSAGVPLLLLLLRCTPRRRGTDLTTFVFLGQQLLLGCGGGRGDGGLGVGELLGEDAPERLRLVVGRRDGAQPGVFR